MTFWAEKTQVEGKGSSTAPPALIEGTAQLGPMSNYEKQNLSIIGKLVQGKKFFIKEY